MVVRGVELAGIVIAGTIAMGCGSSSGGGGGAIPDGTSAQVAASSAETSAAVASLALQASLNQADPANYNALLGTSPVVAASGDASGGAVDIDFGAGTTINGATVGGILTSTYVVAGGTTTVTVTFANLGITTASGGAAVANGTLTLVATTAGSTATGAITGTVIYDTANDQRTVVQNMTYTVDGTAGTTTWSGTTSVTSNAYGVWLATYANVEMSTVATSREISAGVITLTRTLPIPVTVIMTFTGINTGDLLVSPPGIMGTFTL